MTFKRASEGEHGALSTPSRHSPPWPFPLAVLQPPCHPRPAIQHCLFYRRFQTTATVDWLSLSLYSAASEITSRCFLADPSRVSGSRAPSSRLLLHRVQESFRGSKDAERRCANSALVSFPDRTPDICYNERTYIVSPRAYLLSTQGKFSRERGIYYFHNTLNTLG